MTAETTVGKRQPIRKLMLIAAAWVISAVHLLGGQQASEKARATLKLPDTTTELAAFEVASIKPNRSGMSGSQLNFHEGRLSATNVPMKTLVQYTYEIEAPQIQGGPNWLTQDRFDIEAKMDDATAERAKTFSHDQVTRLDRQLVKQLLAERFKLVVHFETKELPVYDLVVAKSGPKLAVTSVKDGGRAYLPDTET